MMSIQKFAIGQFVMMMVLAGLLSSCIKSKSNELPEQKTAMTGQKQLIERGAYLVNVGGCNDCHTPKIFSERGMEMDTSRLLSGHINGSPLPEIDTRALQPGYWTLFNAHLTAAVGPWGLTYARNLTPHPTGIKGWQEKFFIISMRTGKHMGIEHGRPIMPPMPWFNLNHATDDDLKAIFAYLQSLKPIDNYVPEPMSPDEVMKMAKGV